MKKVFLGGTCNESTWRDNMIDMIEIDYFNRHILKHPRMRDLAPGNAEPLPIAAFHHFLAPHNRVQSR